MSVAYDPAKQFEIKVWDVEFRRDPARILMARIYQPQGQGPFPALLDLHGGAWNNQDRTANAPMDEKIAASGVLVAAIDLRVAPEAPYPASVADANYGIRWLKAKAGEWQGDPATVGALGSSSGGHIIELCAMRPNDPRYNAHPLPEAPHLDARLTYVVARSPVSDPFARYQQAERRQWQEMIQFSKKYFDPWETIYDGNPQHILDRKEKVELPPLFILQGELDDNVLPEVQKRFAESYRAAGGKCDLEIFIGCEHRWVAVPGPQTDRAAEMVKEFIARQLQKRR
ncbi:MAG: alpha/beta hydrolase [Candidatus Binatia bacterium]